MRLFSYVTIEMWCADMCQIAVICDRLCRFVTDCWYVLLYADTCWYLICDYCGYRNVFNMWLLSVVLSCENSCIWNVYATYKNSYIWNYIYIVDDYYMMGMLSDWLVVRCDCNILACIELCVNCINCINNLKNIKNINSLNNLNN